MKCPDPDVASVEFVYGAAVASTRSFAGLVARPVDRVHIAASMAPTIETLMAIDGFEVSLRAAASVASFLSREPMSWHEVRVPLRYVPADHVRALLGAGVESGVITFDDDIVAYTPAGAKAALAVLDARASALTAIWANSERQVTELLAMITPVALAATMAGKPSSQLVDRTLVAPNGSQASELWRALAKVRRYRADCHVQAWAAAGHTLETIVALPADSPERLPIEHATNELNADIWAVLLESDQLHFMACLASLDGAGTPT